MHGELMVFPDLVVRKTRGGVTLVNLALGTHLEASADVLAILDYFASPADPDAFLEQYELDLVVLEDLRRHGVLVLRDELPILRGGLLSVARHPLGSKTLLAELREKTPGFAVIGAPFDAGGEAGARHGPAEVRERFPLRFDDRGALGQVLDIDARTSYDATGVGVYDVGDVQGGPSETLEQLGARLRHVVGGAVVAGHVPVLIGGDHSLTRFAVDGVLDHHEELGLIHFDAHHDLYGTAGSLNHSNVFRYVLERKGVKALRQVGLRTLETRPPWCRRVTDPRISWVTAREVANLRRPAQAWEGLPTGIPYYLTFDIDCVDPSLAPETGTRVPGGLTFQQAIDLVRTAARTVRVVGADFMEVSLGWGRSNAAAEITGRCLAELLLARTQRKRIRPSYYRAG